ncbi:MAG: type II secretion system protein GspJ [Candidatus Omnitrophota bacterium]
MFYLKLFKNKIKYYLNIQSGLRPPKFFGGLSLTGLTLVELLVSILIFSIIVVSLYSAFRVGLTAYRKGEKTASFHQKIRLSLDSLASDLRNSYRFSDRDSKFLSENEKITFYTLKPFYSRALKETRQICKAEYYREEKKLFRNISCSTSAFADESKLKPEVLLDNITLFNCKFPYQSEEAGSVNWKDYWKETDKVPLAVKVSLQIEGVDVTTPIILTKSIFLPCGKLGQAEKR